MSRTIPIGVLCVAVFAGVATSSAQTTQPQTSQQTPPTTTTTVPKAPAASEQQPPLSGANSFTEAQAKDRIGKAGYQSVSGLQKDEAGVWRGTAMKEGKQVKIALDFRGNVVVSE